MVDQAQGIARLTGFVFDRLYCLHPAGSRKPMINRKGPLSLCKCSASSVHSCRVQTVSAVLGCQFNDTMALAPVSPAWRAARVDLMRGVVMRLRRLPMQGLES